MSEQIRWKQRFENFERSYTLLEKLSDLESLNEIEKMALIQSFEMCFELSWKLLKDYLFEKGISIATPRDALKYSLDAGYIENGESWFDALQSRNLTSHAYDEILANEIVESIQESYSDLFHDLHIYFSTLLSKE